MTDRSTELLKECRDVIGWPHWWPNDGAEKAKEMVEKIDAYLATPPAPALDAGKKEPVAWLFQCRKPGHFSTFASVDQDDNNWWPPDQWKEATRTPLCECGEPLDLLNATATMEKKP